MVLDDALADLAAGRSATHRYQARRQPGEAEETVFVDSFAAPPRMVIFGAASFTAALTAQAKLLGYRVVVCDARAVFASKARFPLADEVVVDWPDRYLARHGAGLGPRDAICVLNHDPKFDLPALMGALATGVGYIGAMGSRRTQAGRRQRLTEAGASEADLAPYLGPARAGPGGRLTRGDGLVDLRRDSRRPHRPLGGVAGLPLRPHPHGPAQRPSCRRAQPFGGPAVAAAQQDRRAQP